jgi:hypothetical protein
MTYQEYQEYVKRVESFFDENGLGNLSAKADEDGNKEASFSPGPCECCGSKLGGDYYEADGYSTKHKEVLDFDRICRDCIYFAEYGQLDDQTMLDIPDWPGK